MTSDESRGNKWLMIAALASICWIVAAGARADQLSEAIQAAQEAARQAERAAKAALEAAMRDNIPYEVDEDLDKDFYGIREQLQ